MAWSLFLSASSYSLLMDEVFSISICSEISNTSRMELNSTCGLGMDASWTRPPRSWR